MKITEFERVYFTCTGNTCRSPMAERVFLEELIRRNIDSVKVSSRQSSAVKERYEAHDASSSASAGEGAKSGSGSHLPDAATPSKGFSLFSKLGTDVKAGSIISRGTELIIRKNYHDEEFIKNHLAKKFTYDELENASLVLTMESRHKEDLRMNIEAYTPEGFVKVYSLGEILGRPSEEVSDPMVTAYTRIDPIDIKEEGLFPSSSLSKSSTKSIPSGLIESGSILSEPAKSGSDAPDAQETHEIISGKNWFAIGSKRSKGSKRKRFSAGFGKSDREYSFNITPYEKTFTQLTSMIAELFALESVDLKHVSDVFLEDVSAEVTSLNVRIKQLKTSSQGRREPKTSHPVSHLTMESSDAPQFKGHRDYYFFDSDPGDDDIPFIGSGYEYSAGSSRRKSPEKKAAEGLEDVCDSLTDLETAIKSDPAWGEALQHLEAFKAKMSESASQIMAYGFRKRIGKGSSARDLLDYAKIGAYLKKDIIKAIPDIMKAMLERDRDKAFSAYLLGKDLMRAVSDFYSDNELKTMNQLFLKESKNIHSEIALSSLKRKQNEINSRFSRGCSGSSTRFNGESKAYRFTNEPLGDILSHRIAAELPALVVTASADFLCLVAGKGVHDITAVDVSSLANAWGEYKFHSFMSLGYKEFQDRIASPEATWETFPFDLPVSEFSRSLFSNLSPRDKLIKTLKIFQDQFYACSIPSATGLTDKEIYTQLQKVAKGAQAVFYPADVSTFFVQEQVPAGKYGLVYLSNVPDHLRNASNEYDFSQGNMVKFLKPIVKHLHPRGQIITNLQWGNRAREGYALGLKELGFDLEKIPHQEKYSACGYLYSSRR